MKALSLAILLSGITFLLAGCVEPDVTHEPITAPVAPTASPNPAFTPASEPWRPLPLPTATASERAAVGDTWLYLTAFQNDFVSVVDPASGRALHQIPVDACQAGMAVSPDGTRIYVVDGMPASDGQLRVFDTATWQVLHVEPVSDLPIARWPGVDRRRLRLRPQSRVGASVRYPRSTFSARWSVAAGRLRQHRSAGRTTRG